MHGKCYETKTILHVSIHACMVMYRNTWDVRLRAIYQWGLGEGGRAHHMQAMHTLKKQESVGAGVGNTAHLLAPRSLSCSSRPPQISCR